MRTLAKVSEHPTGRLVTLSDPDSGETLAKLHGRACDGLIDGASYELSIAPTGPISGSARRVRL